MDIAILRFDRLGGGSENRKGFSLVELVLVVIIIGVLAAFGVPRTLKSIERSKAAEPFKCPAAVRRLRAGLRLEPIIHLIRLSSSWAPPQCNLVLQFPYSPWGASKKHLWSSESHCSPLPDTGNAR